MLPLLLGYILAVKPGLMRKRFKVQSLWHSQTQSSFQIQAPYWGLYFYILSDAPVGAVLSGDIFHVWACETMNPSFWDNSNTSYTCYLISKLRSWCYRGISFQTSVGETTAVHLHKLSRLFHGSQPHTGVWSLTSTVMGMFCLRTLWLCWSVFNMMTA